MSRRHTDFRGGVLMDEKSQEHSLERKLSQAAQEAAKKAGDDIRKALEARFEAAKLTEHA